MELILLVHQTHIEKFKPEQGITRVEKGKVSHINVGNGIRNIDDKIDHSD